MAGGGLGSRLAVERHAMLWFWIAVAVMQAAAIGCCIWHARMQGALRPGRAGRMQGVAIFATALCLIGVFCVLSYYGSRMYSE